MKIKKILLSAALILTLTASTETYVLAAGNVAEKVSIPDEASVKPRADIIEWRYKTVGGKLYRRQYNYSKQVWIGNWELC